MGHREDLLAGARRCLEERGYARTTARDLVAESGTNLASIGYHFGSKEALLNAAIGASFEEWTERIREMLSMTDGVHDPDPFRRLAATWNAMLASFAEFRGLAVAFVEAVAQSERQPEVRSLLAASYAQTRHSVAAIVTELTGGLPERQADALASFQIAMCDGLLVQWLIDPAATSSGDALAAALAAVTVAPDG